MNIVTQILAIRHGETAWNRQGRYQGQTDIELNEAGRVQACQVAQALADVPIDAVFTSDLARAAQTAAELVRHRAMAATELASLREQHFGVFQGLRADEIVLRWPQDQARWLRREPDFGPQSGETRSAFNRRCLEAVLQLAAAHAGRTIAIVCHGGVLDCLYRAARGLPLDAPRNWSLENAAINRLQWGHDGLVVLDWGDTAHLGRAALDERAELFPAH